MAAGTTRLLNGIVHMCFFKASAFDLVTAKAQPRLFRFEKAKALGRGMGRMALNTTLLNRRMPVLFAGDLFTKRLVTFKAELTTSPNQIGRIF